MGSTERDDRHRPGPADAGLDDRKASILRAVVEQYIETAQPVGSTRLARTDAVKVSPATVRNEMAQLEQAGYLEQPHTSAGRIPTEKGYRFFVDSLAGAPVLAEPHEAQVSTFFARAHGELEEMLDDTTRLLADLTDYAAVVVSPPHDSGTVRAVELVGLSERVALLVLVLSNGTVEKHTVEYERAVSDTDLHAATGRLREALLGADRSELEAIPSPSGDTIVDRSWAALAPGPLSDAEVYVGGTSRMASAFGAVETVKQVLAILEQQLVVVSLLRDVVDRGLRVAIGTETGVTRLEDCSVVVAPYLVAGEPVGTVGVLGPTRMNYPQALAAVALVGQRLGSHLSEG